LERRNVEIAEGKVRFARSYVLLYSRNPECACIDDSKKHWYRNEGLVHLRGNYLHGPRDPRSLAIRKPAEDCWRPTKETKHLEASALRF